MDNIYNSTFSVDAYNKFLADYQELKTKFKSYGDLKKTLKEAARSRGFSVKVAQQNTSMATFFCGLGDNPVKKKVKPPKTDCKWVLTARRFKNKKNNMHYWAVDNSPVDHNHPLVPLEKIKSNDEEKRKRKATENKDEEEKETSERKNKLILPPRKKQKKIADAPDLIILRSKETINSVCTNSSGIQLEP